MKDIQVGLIGFGNIGAGVVKLLRENAVVIRNKVGAGIVLKRIADLDITTDRGVVVEPGVLTTSVDDIFNDPEISIVIELIGGYEPAKSFVLKAIEKGKHIVTANKALLALHGSDIYAAATRKGVEVQFEASVGGGIPVLTAIKSNLAANNFSSVFGIMNGTCNYILTRMTQEGADFADVLKAAQELGYAEPDPTFDVEGVDTAHKLAVLISLCFGTRIDFNSIHTEGISNINGLDVKYAAEFGYRIKLLAIGKCVDGAIEARVHPTMIPLDSPLADINGVFNAIRLTGDFVGPVMFSGRGAGQNPTASAIVGDLIGLSRSMKAGGAGRRMSPLGYLDEAIVTIPVKPMADIVSKYMLRFSALDKPGVLGGIAGSLGKHGISIESMVQTAHEVDDAAPVPIVIMTHEAREGSIQEALAEIDQLDIICQKTSFIRIEDNLV